MAAKDNDISCLRWREQTAAGRWGIFCSWVIMKNRSIVIMLWVIALGVFAGWGIVTQNWGLAAAFLLGLISFPLIWIFTRDK